MSEAVSINPATGKILQKYERITSAQAEALVAKTRERFAEWKHLPFAQRDAFMYEVAQVLEKDKQAYATLITNEMGKTYAAAVAEIEKCALVCRYFAGNAEQFLKQQTVATEAQESFVTFDPLGTVLAIMPWNFPFYQAIRFAAPALMAGNTAVLKHASNVQGCAHAIEALFVKAGLPENVFTNLNISSNDMEALISNKNIAAVTLTGSGAAGKSVAATAGKHLKKCVLELGGSDAYIITGSVDLNKAVKLCVKARLQNNGQTCIAAKRFIVEEKIYDAFLEKFTDAMQQAKMGDPFDEASFYGPMAREDLRSELHQQVQESIDQGAVLTTGGFIPQMQGAYYPATVLADVKPRMVAFDEELFGPVAAVIKAKNVEEAIALANDSEFGLGAAVLTGDIDSARKTASHHIEAGNVFINAIVASDPRLPFGGIKSSGFGRELSAYGIKEFVNIKTVWIESEIKI